MAAVDASHGGHGQRAAPRASASASGSSRGGSSWRRQGRASPAPSAPAWGPTRRRRPLGNSSVRPDHASRGELPDATERPRNFSFFFLSAGPDEARSGAPHPRAQEMQRWRTRGGATTAGQRRRVVVAPLPGKGDVLPICVGFPMSNVAAVGTNGMVALWWWWWKCRALAVLGSAGSMHCTDGATV